MLDDNQHDGRKGDDPEQGITEFGTGSQIVTTHSNEYPKDEPAAKFVAQFPGSINPTVTSNPGPIYLSKSRAPDRVLWVVFNFLKIFISCN